MTGSTIPFSGDYESHAFKVRDIDKLSVQYVVSGSTILPFPTFTGFIDLSNSDPTINGGELMWSEDTTMRTIFSGSATNFTSSQGSHAILTKTASGDWLGASYFRLRMVPTNVSASGSLKINIFGQHS